MVEENENVEREQERERVAQAIQSLQEENDRLVREKNDLADMIEKMKARGAGQPAEPALTSLPPCVILTDADRRGRDRHSLTTGDVHNGHRIWIGKHAKWFEHIADEDGCGVFVPVD